MVGIKIIKATQIGSKYSQQKRISWSYRKRGKVALNKTNKKQKKHVLIPNIILWRFKTDSFKNISGKWYPPKNKILDMQLNSTIEEYSPRKKKTKIVAPCSVKNPATNSDSLLFYRLFY